MGVAAGGEKLMPVEVELAAGPPAAPKEVLDRPVAFYVMSVRFFAKNI